MVVAMALVMDVGSIRQLQLARPKFNLVKNYIKTDNDNPNFLEDIASSSF